MVRARRGVLFHVDAVQVPGVLPLDVAALGADLVALSAHKLEGPKGVGALWIRRGTHLLAQQHGGAQERHRRGGTEHVAGAAGFARALDLAVAERDATAARLRALRDRLAAAVLAVPGVELTGHPVERLPGILSVLVRDVDGAETVLALDLEGIGASQGSACSTGSAEPGHVLTAMGHGAADARSGLRLSLGRTTTDAEIEEAARVVPAVLRRLREGAAEARRAAPGDGPGGELVAFPGRRAGGADG